MIIREKSHSFYHWLIVLVCCGMACSSVGLVTNCMGVFYLPIAQTLNVGRGTISVFATIISITTALTSPLAGALIWQFNLRVVLTTGSALISLGFILSC